MLPESSMKEKDKRQEAQDKSYEIKVCHWLTLDFGFITASDSSNFYIFVTSNKEICTEHTHAGS